MSFSIQLAVSFRGALSGQGLRQQAQTILWRQRPSARPRCSWRSMIASRAAATTSRCVASRSTSFASQHRTIDIFNSSQHRGRFSGKFWDKYNSNHVCLRRFSGSANKDIDFNKKKDGKESDNHLKELKENEFTADTNKHHHQQQRQQQFWANWLRALQSPPNMITMGRIVGSPVIAYWIVAGEHQLAVLGCVVAGASDWLDGYLAKNHNMSTVLGGYLDPMADKILINTLSVALWYTDVLPTPLVALWLGRDVLLIAGSALHVRSQSKDNLTAFDPTVTPLKVNPTMLSKTNTVLQFATLGLGIAYPLYNIPPEMLSGFCYLTGFTTIASGFSYIGMSAFEDSGNDEHSSSKKS